MRRAIGHRMDEQFNTLIEKYPEAKSGKPDHCKEQMKQIDRMMAEVL